MAMLAEPKRKKRSLNLRGKNAWSEDQNKFGQQMMQKMGWTPGKGLGVKENGITDHVKVRFKDDNQGVGFKDTGDQWTEHETNYEALLRNLHGGEVDSTKLHSETSLEEKSKKLQSRLHYKKFTRGKDITKYSHKDLANIFGKKSLHSKVVKDVQEKVAEESTNSDLKLVNSGCLKDYFNNKLKRLNNDDVKKNSFEDEASSVGFTGFACETTSSEIEVTKDKCSFEFYKARYSCFQQSESLPSTIEVDDSKTSKEKKSKTKKKRDKSKDVFTVDYVSEEMVSTKCIDLTEDSQNCKEASRKKRMHVETSSTIEYDQVQTVPTKKKKKSKSEDVIILESCEDESSKSKTLIDTAEIVHCKKSSSKKKKNKNLVSDDYTNDCHLEESKEMKIENDTDVACVKKDILINSGDIIILDSIQNLEESNSDNMITSEENSKHKIKNGRKKRTKFRPFSLNDLHKDKHCDRSKSGKVSELQINNILNDADSVLINSFKNTRKLLKKGLDLSNMSELRSRCKSLNENLEKTVQVIEEEDNNIKLPSQNEISSNGVKEENKIIECGSKIRHKKKHGKDQDIVDKTKINRKKRTFKPFVDTFHSSSNEICFDSDVEVIENQPEFDLSQNGIVKQDIVEIKSEIPDIKLEVDNIKSELCESNDIKKEDDIENEIFGIEIKPKVETFVAMFSLHTVSNSWELLQLRKMLNDPYLSTSRRDYLNNRILELNNIIIQEMQKNDKWDQFQLLEKLCLLYANGSLSPDEKQQVECVLMALRDKVIGEVMKDMGDTDGDYSKSIERLQTVLRLPCLSIDDRSRILNKVLELRSKAANSLIKKAHQPMDDSVQLLEKIQNIMNDPFLLEENKAKLLHKIRFLRNKTVCKLAKVPMTDAESDADLLNKLKILLRDKTLSDYKRLQIVDKIRNFEMCAKTALKEAKTELREKLECNLEEVLGFDGTNLQYMKGYGIVNPQYVRCINIWLINKETKCS